MHFKTKQFRKFTKLSGASSMTHTVWTKDWLLRYPVYLVLNGPPVNFVDAFGFFLDFKKE